jgi:hypothetical protein
MKRKLQLALLGAVTLFVETAMAQTDVTSTYIKDAGFEIAQDANGNSLVQKSNLSTGAGNCKAIGVNWTVSQGTNCAGGVFAYGSTNTINNVKAPLTTPTTGSANALALTCGWGDNVTYTQASSISLPAGIYALSYKAYNANSSATYFKSIVGFVSSKGSSQLSSKTSFTYNVWDADVISFTLTETAEGKFQVGGTSKSGSGSGSSAKLFIDGLSLTYTATVTTISNAISSATAINNILKNNDLTTAINAAQVVVDNNGRTQTDTDNAINDLNVAIQTAKNNIGNIQSGTDVTPLFVTNPSFETGSLTGWVCNTASDTGVRFNSNSSYTTIGVDGSYLFNTWGGTAAKYVKQTLTNLPAGFYTVSALIASDAGNSINLYAGTATSSVGASASGKGVFVKGVTDLVQVASGGSLEIGITSTSWYKADNFVLTYYSPLYEAQKLYDGTDKMSAATKNALAIAIAAGGGNENISALQTAITNATTSIASYKIISGGVPDNSLTNWTCANSNTFQVNTWSTEGTSDGTGMITPFIENWIASGSILSDGKITYTLAGLDPGYYKASSLVRIYSEAGNTISGASYFVGNKSIDIPAKGTSSTSGTKKIIYGTFSTTGEVNDDGILTFGVNIASATFNWLSIKSTTVSYIGTSNTEAYESALAAAQTALSNSDYANVTGDERTALQTAITNYSSITENYDVVADALTEVTSAFISAKASYDALITAQMSTTDPNLAYASTTVKTAFANSLKTTVTSAADAMTKIAAIKTALRAYYESYAKAEGVEGATDYSSLITNTQFTNGTNGWTVTQTGGTSGVLSSEPWTAADGTTAYSYYDYYNSDTNIQHVKQTVTLDAGRYLLTIKSRAQKGLYTYIAADGDTTELQEIGNTGGVFDRGWNDGSVEFQILPNGSTTIEWYSSPVGGKHAGWASFGDVRLIRLGNAIDTLDEKANYIPAISTSVDIILKHSFSPGKWNTICVPFPITSGEITSLLGSDAKVASFNSQSDDVLKFTTASSIEANKPYLVYIPAATTATSFNFEGKDVTTGTPEITVTDGAVTFVGTYSSMTIPEGNFFISNNTFYKAPGTPEVTLKPFRAYFKLITPVAAKQMDISIDGETTSVSNIDADVVTPATIYNLNGQRVRSNATSTEGLAKGVYIMSGKSVVVK